MLKVSKLKPQPIDLSFIEPLPEQILGKRKNPEEIFICSNNTKKLKFSDYST